MSAKLLKKKVIELVSERTANDFIVKYRKGNRINVGTIMIDLRVSRPTATNLVSTMLQRKKLIPVFEIGDKHKWYVVR